MISFNVPNVITIGLIAVASIALAKFAANATGIGVSWL